MRTLLESGREVQGLLDGHGYPNCIVGGLAIQRWGEIRATRDVDITLFTGLDRDSEAIDLLLGAFQPLLPDARQVAEAFRVLRLLVEGTPVDVALAAFEFESRMIARASAAEYLPGLTLRTCSAEDLFVMKCFAGRPQDKVDLIGIRLRQHDRLDWTLVRSELEHLAVLSEDPTGLRNLENCLAAELEDLP